MMLLGRAQNTAANGKETRGKSRVLNMNLAFVDSSLMNQFGNESHICLPVFSFLVSSNGRALYFLYTANVFLS